MNAPSGEIEHINYLSDHIGALFLNEEYSDIVFLVEGLYEFIILSISIIYPSLFDEAKENYRRKNLQLEIWYSSMMLTFCESSFNQLSYSCVFFISVFFRYKNPTS